MKRIAIVCLAVVIFASLLQLARADRNRNVVVVNPYAVPVAVPVAPYAPYAYSSSCAQQQAYMAPPRSAEDILADHLASKLSERLGIPLQPQIRKIAAPPTVFATKCAGCHAKADSDLGKPAFTVVDAMPPEQRLKAIQDIVTDRMPKNGKLSPQEASQLIRELTSKPQAAPEPPVADDRPPPPSQEPPPAPQQ